MSDKAKRDRLNDFDRFKVMIARKQRSFRLRQLATDKKAVSKKPAAAPKQAASQAKKGKKK